jgi:hypothetical protein
MYGPLIEDIYVDLNTGCVGGCVPPCKRCAGILIRNVCVWPLVSDVDPNKGYVCVAPFKAM